MSDPSHGEGGLQVSIRVVYLALLVAAPLALGAVHAFAYVPLLTAAFFMGLASWGHGHWARAHGLPVPVVPATSGLLALHGLVLVQLVPLPPGLLKLVSPGSFAFYDYISLVPLTEWRPISVSPADTLRGLVFLAAMSLLYATAFREFAETRWRRRAAAAVVATALFMTLEALVQAASSDPERIYGIWKPTWAWAVFGPYVNKNHFAGYVVMAIPLAMASAQSALRELSRGWRRRRIGWLALGDQAGHAFVRRAAVSMALIVGVLVSRSRGGVMAFVLSTLGAPLLLKRRLWAVAVLVVLALGAMGLLGTGGLTSYATRGLQDPRLVMWPDALRMVPDFPAFGSGMNTFGSAYPRYQRVWTSVWFGQAHNEYLQALLDMGAAGLVLVTALLLRLVAGATRHAAASVIGIGVLGSLLASAIHNLVDFNWQIPANAATFAMLAGLAMQDPAPDMRGLTPPRGRA